MASLDPQLAILDFDRTLGDTGTAMKRLYAVIERGDYAVDAGKLRDAQQSAEAAGRSFSPLRFINEHVHDMQHFREAYLDFEQMPLLYEDAALFLQVLAAAKIPFMVMSYGDDLEWQELKIRASGYAGPLRLIEHKDKGLEIATFKVGDTYTVSGSDYSLSAASICLIDDKADSFRGLPADCTGVWLRRSEELLPSQRGNVPKHVTIASRLDELTVVGGQVQHPDNS